ncbi:unnamed protein product [Ceratitis capitata]|uniref:(Mediterranean fruit fly) hypothetical protein n=1 Tax=Ceratitis capitata TaxID=7213 RepID=A0A811V4E2_CERCA|nr:unnamed protein product [Ceratitis capitata]
MHLLPASVPAFEKLTKTEQKATNNINNKYCSKQIIHLRKNKIHTDTCTIIKHILSHHQLVSVGFKRPSTTNVPRVRRSYRLERTLLRCVQCAFSGALYQNCVKFALTVGREIGNS